MAGEPGLIGCACVLVAFEDCVGGCAIALEADVRSLFPLSPTLFPSAAAQNALKHCHLPLEPPLLSFEPPLLSFEPPLLSNGVRLDPNDARLYPDVGLLLPLVVLHLSDNGAN